jgi:branched-subunit amino acid aminotransferase/4-amino-4-deoxychorismate lyase
MVTDSSFANIVFKRGKKWYTPWAPLLKGTMRSKAIGKEPYSGRGDTPEGYL